MHEGGVSKFTVHPIYAKSITIPVIEKCTAQWGRQHKHKHNQLSAHKIKRKQRGGFCEVTRKHQLCDGRLEPSAGRATCTSILKHLWFGKDAEGPQCAERKKPEEMWIVRKKSSRLYC